MNQASLLHHFAENTEATLHAADTLAEPLQYAAQLLAETVHRDGKIMVCGAAETAFLAPYLCARLAGQLERERPPLQALALSADNGWPLQQQTVDAAALQQGVARSLVQQLQQHGHTDDTLLLFSSDAQQPFALQIKDAAQAHGIPVVWLHAGQPADAVGEFDVELALEQPRSMRAIEVMLLLAHTLLDALDSELLGDDDNTEMEIEEWPHNSMD